MNTYVVVVQKTHGPRANPINYRAKVVVHAATEEQARFLATERIPGDVYTVRQVGFGETFVLRA